MVRKAAYSSILCLLSLALLSCGSPLAGNGGTTSEASAPDVSRAQPSAFVQASSETTASGKSSPIASAPATPPATTEPAATRPVPTARASQQVSESPAPEVTAETDAETAATTVAGGAEVVYNADRASLPDVTELQPEGTSFALELPAEWYAGEDSGSGDLLASNTNDESQPYALIQIRTTLVGGPDRTPLDSLEVVELLFPLEQGVANFEPQSKRAATVNGLAAHEGSYRFELNGTPHRRRTVAVHGPENLYTISYVAPEELWAQYEPVFDNALHSFRELASQSNARYGYTAETQGTERER